MREITQSQFYMWRTLFAVAHADDVVTEDEVKFMAQILEDINFSDAQRLILKEDITDPKDCEQMFDHITEQKDRTAFFNFAHDLVWVDGDFGSEEQSIMVKLHQKHYKETDVDDLIGNVSLELEGPMPHTSKSRQHQKADRKKKDIRKGLFSFHRRFLDIINGDD